VVAPNLERGDQLAEVVFELLRRAKGKFANGGAKAIGADDEVELRFAGMLKLDAHFFGTFLQERSRRRK
jgi:hypothetical protein